MTARIKHPRIRLALAILGILYLVALVGGTCHTACVVSDAGESRGHDPSEDNITECSRIARKALR